MPGTIQVSVLSLLDLPTEPNNTHLLSLKVIMGKREYRTGTGTGDFSFPVVSLRENLILKLLDTEGNVVSRTEIKTMSVVEKGIWDDLFPLEGGGCVRMKLHFSLIEEERKRIREMRDSALKRKYGELLKGDIKSSLCEQKTEGALINQLQQTDPPLVDADGHSKVYISDGSGNQLSSATFPKFEEQSVQSFERVIPRPAEVSKEIIEIRPPPDGIQERHISLDKCLDTHIEFPVSLVPGVATKNISSTSAEVEEGQINSPQIKNLLQKNSNSNIQKMINAFENNTSQGLGAHANLRTKAQLSKINIGDSSRRTTSREWETEKLKLPQTMAKSFLAGTLSDISFQQNPKFFKSLIVNRKVDNGHLNHVIDPETMGQNNPLLDLQSGFKNMETCEDKVSKVADDEGSSMEILHNEQSQSSEVRNYVLMPIETEETDNLSESAEHVSEREDPKPFEVGKDPTIFLDRNSNASHKKIELFTVQKGGFSLDQQAACGTSDQTPPRDNGEESEILGFKDSPTGETNQSKDKMDDHIGTIGQTVTNYFQPPETNVKLVHREENKKEEQTLLEEDQLSRKMIDRSMYVDEPCSYCSDQTGSFSAIIKDNDCRCCKIHSYEQTVYGSSSETLELSTYYDYEKCPFRSLGIWIPRYLCTTTGSKQLRSLIDCRNIHIRTHPVEKSLASMEAIEKQKMHDDIIIEVRKIEKIPCSYEKSNAENPLGIQKPHQGLLEQGIQIITVLVACGTILLNTR